jgi:hypothetical protein
MRAQKLGKIGLFLNLLFFIGYNFYFGWNFTAESNLEAFCDDLFKSNIGFFLIVYFWSLPKLYTKLLNFFNVK